MDEKQKTNYFMKQSRFNNQLEKKAFFPEHLNRFAFF